MHAPTVRRERPPKLGVWRVLPQETQRWSLIAISRYEHVMLDPALEDRLYWGKRKQSVGLLFFFRLVCLATRGSAPLLNKRKFSVPGYYTAVFQGRGVRLMTCALFLRRELTIDRRTVHDTLNRPSAFQNKALGELGKIKPFQMRGADSVNAVVKIEPVNIDAARCRQNKTPQVLRPAGLLPGYPSNVDDPF